MKIFCERLNELMQKHGVTQKQLAENICTTQQAISRYLRGERTPDIEVLARIAAFFEISSDYLIGLEDEDGTKKGFR